MKPPAGWRDVFPLHILARGREYWCAGAVVNLVGTEEGYHAEVIGTERYYVEIAIAQGKVQMMNCSCPYASEGYFCKHMAAMLFAAEEGCSSEARERDAETLLGLASLDQIADFLRERFRVDFALRSSFVRWMTPVCMEQTQDVSTVNVRALIREYAEAYEQYLNEYWSDEEASESVREYLHQVVDPLFAKQNYGSAFQHLTEIVDCMAGYAIFSQVPDTEMDASIVLRLRCLVDGSAGTPLEEEIFAWVCEKRQQSVIPESVDQIFEECFNSEDFLRQKLVIVEAKSAECAKEDSPLRYDFGTWIMRKALFLSRLGGCEKEVEELLCQNWRADVCGIMPIFRSGRSSWRTHHQRRRKW